MFYTESHEWIDLKEKVGTVGITEFAQKELGEVVYVELPKVGQIVKMGEEVCVIESTKAAADVYAPLSGKIAAVNEALKNAPSHLNTSPEKAGWLFKIELSNPKELDHLLSPSAYRTLIS